MTKSISYNALDAAFGYVANNGNLLIVCEGAPTDYAAAIALKSNTGTMLAQIDMTAGLGNGTYDVSNGDISGRKLTVAMLQITSAQESGTADHIAIVDTVNEELLLVTTITTPAAVTANASLTLESFSDEIRDPA